MKILHTADWHLGIELHKMSLKEDQRYILFQLIHIVKEQDIDVVIISGDIYDTALASKDAIELFDEVMTVLCKEMHKQVIVIAGNHDGAQRLASMNRLLHEMGLHIYGKLEQVIQPLIIDDCAFYPLPYFHLETFKQVYHCDVNSIEAAISIVNEQAKKEVPDKKHLLLAHTFCANAIVSQSDRFANLGGSDLVSAAVMDGFDYVALGHLHRKQAITEKVWYSGSILPYSFAEAAYDKAVLIYDSHTDTVSESMLTPLHPLITLSATFEDLQEQLHQLPEQNSYYKVELLDRSVTFEMMQYIKERLPQLLQLTGKSAAMNQAIRIQVEDMDQMSDLDIVKQFFLDYYDMPLGETEIALFLQASKEQEEEHAA